MTRNLARAITLLALAGVATSAPAQDARTAPSASGCYRFAFGSWTPPLDWLRSGHDSATRDFVREARPSGSVHGGASPSGGREPAVLDSSPGGQELVLFPSWWPAGIVVEFPPFASARDTVRGVARAFVADGRADVPTARVAVWRVPCGAGRGAPIDTTGEKH